MRFEGVYAVLPTPFDAAGEVDEASLRRVVRLYLEAGVDGLTVLGVTSEVARLDDAERERVLAVVLDEVAGRAPVVAGTTAEGTRACVGYSRRAVAAGAAAVMVSPPRMAKPASEAIVRHYRAVAEAIEAPIVVQDYPPVSGYAMEPWLLVRTRGRSSSRTRRRRSRRLASSRRRAISTCVCSAVWAASTCSRS
jgi:4-hydroxy-tetrahydrodipicolinate synthase